MDCSGKHLGCPGRLAPGQAEDYSTDLVAIGQRSKGLSDSLSGNAPDAGLMGNRLAGNGRYLRGKACPTLCRKIYSACCCVVGAE